MAEIPRASAVRGKIIRYIWTEGPTKGKTYDHVFHGDGTVEWHDVGSPDVPSGAGASKASPSEKQAATPERAPYAAMEAAQEVYCGVVSRALGLYAHGRAGLQDLADGRHRVRRDHLGSGRGTLRGDELGGDEEG